MPWEPGPGGGVWDSYNAIMQGANNLQKQSYDNAIRKAQADYAPLTTKAEAASKLAYANLMGPQYMAKLMGNEDILANIPDDQKYTILNMLMNSGMNQNSNNNSLTNVNNSPKKSTNNSLVDMLMSSLNKNSNSLNKQSNISPPVNNDILNNQPNISQQDRENAIRMQPGDATVIQGNQTPQMIPKSQLQQPPIGINNSQIPIDQNNINQGNNQNFAGNVANYEGLKAEGKESGKIRAQDIKELNDSYFHAQTAQNTLDSLSDVVSSPEFEQIRQIPILGKNELSYYAKFGTPKQQEMVGKYYTLTGNIVKDTASEFKGQFRTGEQKLVNSMKADPSDTVDVARGKIEALSSMNKMLSERSRITSELMTKNHINKLQAQEVADKQVNGKEIRDQLHNKIYPKPIQEDIDFMAKKYNISPDEVKNRLKKKGII